MIYRSVGALVRGQKTLSLGPHATVQEAAEMMAAHRVGAIPVIDDSGRLVGLFTERDLLNRVVAKRLVPAELRLSEVMTADPITVSPETSLVRSLTTMFEHRFRHLPVLEGDRVIGVLSCRDIPADYWMLQSKWEAAQNELRAAVA
jgi:CBS domain-containing protein